MRFPQCECPADDAALAAGTCGTPDDPESCGRPATTLVRCVGYVCPGHTPVALEIAADRDPTGAATVRTVDLVNVTYAYRVKMTDPTTGRVTWIGDYATRRIALNAARRFI